jgi:hypothetical protein
MSRKHPTQMDLEEENRNLRKLIVMLKKQMTRARENSREVDELISSFDLYEDLDTQSKLFELQLQAKKSKREEEKEKEEEIVEFTLPNGEVRRFSRNSGISKKAG